MQRYPFQPGTHPYSHKPFILLQPVHLSGQFLAQSSPQNHLGQPEEKKKYSSKTSVRVYVCSCVRDVCILAVDNDFRHITQNYITKKIKQKKPLILKRY